MATVVPATHAKECTASKGISAETVKPAAHSKECTVAKEISVKTDKPVATTCLRVVQLFGVKAKMFLLLECALVSMGMTPVMNFLYNGVHISSDLSHGIMFGFLAALGMLGALAAWVLAYPKRYRPVWVVLVGVTTVTVMCLLGCVANTMYDGTVFLKHLNQKELFTLEYKVLLALKTIGRISPNILWMAFYHGPIQSKGVFAAFCVWVGLVLLYDVLETDALPLIILMGALYLIWLSVGLFGGHVFWKKPEFISGGHPSFIGWSGIWIAYGAAALIIFFMTVYSQLEGQPLIRIAVWLGFKLLVFGLINIANKQGCYAMKGDIKVLMLTFQQVLGYQFGTSLIFLAMKPFGFEFFFVLLLKAFLFISTKGGMFLKLHNKLLQWIPQTKLRGTKVASLLLKFTEVAGDRGPPYLHMRTTDSHGHVFLTQVFLTDLIYSDMALLSGVVCCLGCAVVVGTELVLLQYFPDTFQHGIFTYSIHDDVNPLHVFYGYLFAMAWNMLIALVVLWLFLRDRTSIIVTDVFQGVIQKKRNLTDRVRSISVRLKKHVHEDGPSTRNKIIPKENENPIEIKKSQSTELGHRSTTILQQEFNKAEMLLHVFEQRVFHKHAFYLYFWTAFTIICVFYFVAKHNWNKFMTECGYTPANRSYFHNVLARVELPMDEACRFYADNDTVDAMNISELFVYPAVVPTYLNGTISLFFSPWS